MRQIIVVNIRGNLDMSMIYCSKERKWNKNNHAGLNTETDEIIQMAAFPIADTEVACFNRFVTILVLGMI